ncbi:MAG: hypothetical protein OEZ59_09085 [Deltaproteobacteria bacterium]|nr:hypothetical protein [Deltaproteobacteria bacterium]
MNQKPKTLLLVGVAVVLLGLTGFGVVHHLHGDSHSHDSHFHDSHGPGEASLSLNNGNKWQADEHTRGSMARMATIITNGSSLNDMDAYRGMAGNLKAELQTLITGCTMTGPAHDQLHVYLSLLIPRLEALETAGQVELARREVQEIEILLGTYHKFFS